MVKSDDAVTVHHENCDLMSRIDINTLTTQYNVLQTTRETLENQRLLRDNGSVIAGQNWVDGRQATGLLGLRDHHR